MSSRGELNQGKKSKAAKLRTEKKLTKIDEEMQGVVPSMQDGAGEEAGGGQATESISAGNGEEGLPKHPKISTNQQVRGMVGQAWGVILANNSPSRFYQRSEQLVETRQCEGQYEIAPVTRTGLFYTLTEQADWLFVSDDGRAEATSPPASLINCMLHKPHHALPKLEHLTHIPILTPEGAILAEPGYHPASRTFVATGSDLAALQMAESVDVARLASAKSLILDAFLGDFPFETQADRANAVAMLLQPFVRLYLADAPTPLHVVSAPAPGTGKGLLCSSVALVVTGMPMAAMAANRGEDEMRKRTSSLLARDARYVVIDNLPERSRLDSASLASVLTSTRWTDRRLGGNAMPVLTNSAVWVLNGNNPRLSGELARRSIQIRLNARTERPWERREFQHEDLLQWVSQNRCELVSACLALVQHWVQCGRPLWSGAPIGSFERWCGVMGEILEAAGIAGFLENRYALFEVADLELNEWRTLVSLWAEKAPAELVKTTELLALADEAEVLGDVIGGGSEKSRVSRLGRALQQRVDSVIGEHVIRRGQAIRNAGRYRLEAASRPIQH